MFLFDGMENFLRMMRVYLFGRGLLSLAIVTASFIGAWAGSLIIPAVVVAVGGGILNAVMRLSSQAIYEEKMVELYRNDIARDLGMAPQRVTREHLKIAAQDNDVIAQALTRQKRINWISFATSALAGAVTLGLLYLTLVPGPIGAEGLVHNVVAQKFAEFFGEGTVGTILKFLSVGMISGVSSLIFHDGLEALIGHGTGVAKAAAHDLILAVDREVTRGRSVSPEQVYGVLVAGDLELQQAIKQQFGKSYSQMKPEEQRTVLSTIGVLNEMQMLATGVSQGTVKPGHLAYMIGEARGNRQSQATVQTPEVPTPVMAPVAAPTPVRSNFVERLNLAPREAAASHAERVQATRASNVLTV